MVGLRSSSDGKSPGFPILVLGGDHGDLPLPALGGAAVARLLVEQDVSLVADTSNLTVGERTRWFIDFATTLHRLNRAPLQLVLDEAHLFAPQGKIPDPEAGRMLHAANTLASAGRSRGIRLTMITQRPAKLHKDSLTCADTLIAMRVLAPQDREAVQDWIKGCGDLVAGKAVLDSLASLQRGEGWVWYPEGGYLKRTKFPAIKTFDSSATPVDGHAAPAPKRAADVDMTEIKAALAEAVREAEANDPKLLRQRIAELEAAARKPREMVVDTAALAAEYTRGREETFDEVWLLANPLLDPLHRLHEQGQQFFDGLRRVHDAAPAPRPSPQTPAPSMARAAPARRQTSAGHGISLPTGERATLIACAQHPGGCTREQLSVLTGYKRSSRDAYIQRLREKAYLETSPDRITATDSGVDALGADFEPLPTGVGLREYWMNRLPEGEKRVLQVLVDAYPQSVARTAIDEATGYQRSSRDAYIQRLKSRQLVTIQGRGEVQTSHDLFG